jgi:murein peptide amidase A
MNAALTTSPPLDRDKVGIFDAPFDAARELLEPLVALSDTSDYIVGGCAGTLSFAEQHYNIPRFAFLGPPGGGDTVRLGIFAALRGDETEGAAAAVEFLRQLEALPRLARGYHIYVYPICNPTGFEDGTPRSRSGCDLTAEFWGGSREPEIHYLEQELETLRFDGVVALLSGTNACGLRGFTPSPVLGEALVAPAVQAAAAAFPAQHEEDLNTTESRALGMGRLRSVLTRSYDSNPSPFEIVLETPRQAPTMAKVQATVAALKSILDSYRLLHSIRANI